MPDGAASSGVSDCELGVLLCPSRAPGPEPWLRKEGMKGGRRNQLAANL